MYVCVADVAIGPRELSTAPVEWFQTWSSAYVQTLMLFPYPVHALQASGEGSVCGKCEIQSHRAIRCSSTMTQRSTYANVQTLALFPYPEHALQTSGEAVYVADVGVSTRELFAAPVESTCALAKLGKVDPAPALKLPGVVAFVGTCLFSSIHICTSSSCMCSLYNSCVVVCSASTPGRRSENAGEPQGPAHAALSACSVNSKNMRS